MYMYIPVSACILHVHVPVSACILHITARLVRYRYHCVCLHCDIFTHSFFRRPQSWKGDFLSRRETQRTDTQQNLDVVGESMATTREPRLHPPERKPSKVAKIYRRIVNPSKGMDTMEGSGYFSQTNLDKAVSTLPPIGHQEYVGEFK